MKTPHAPVPYKIVGNEIATVKDNIFVASVEGEIPTHRDEANAEFIVRACNSHYELLEKTEAYIEAVNAYYRENPSPETVGEKCADLILADEALRAAIAEIRKKSN